MTITLSFFGAAGTVTGSCFVVTGPQCRVLVDCGMFQGSKTLKQLNYDPFPFDVRQIDAVLLTHAHIDHSGLLPKLVLAGFDGPVHATPGTIGLLGCMLPDSGHIQEFEVEQLNRRGRQRGEAEVAPIYTQADAREMLRQLRPVAWNSWLAVGRGMRARWWNAGHLLGSASIEIEVAQPDQRPLRLLFSGDIGPRYRVFEAAAEGPNDLDAVIMEATYGDMDRQELTPGRRRDMLGAEVRDSQERGAALLIPSFAVERTQEVVTDLVALMGRNEVNRAPIFVDSPLASEATAVFQRFSSDLANGAELRSAFASPHLRMVSSAEESKALARIDGFHIVIAGSGMCEAGRIRHHLKRWLPDRRATVLMVGYQATGTLGRIMLDGARAVRIQGEEVAVRAAIRMLDCYSGHADAPELVEWLRQRGPIGSAVFLTHGEEPALAALKQRLAEAPGTDGPRVIVPRMDDTYEIDIGHVHDVTPSTGRRIAPEMAAHLDWHNDLSQLILDINDGLRRAADEPARQRILRRLRRALRSGNDQH